MIHVDLFLLFVKSFFSMLVSGRRLGSRSFRSELFFRFLKSLFSSSKKRPINWLRDRQKSLSAPIKSNKVTFEKAIIEGVNCLWCKPDADLPSTIIIYFHGGGYVFGSVDTYQNVLSDLALESNAWVLGVDYRLGPEYLFPAAQDDCLDVGRAILKEFSSQRVVLAGDSAGGGLVMASHQSLVAEGGKYKAAALVLISPWLEPDNRLGSMVSNETSDVLDRNLLEKWRQLYMPDTLTNHPRVNFREMDCVGLVPIYIQAAEDEIFIDQIRDFSKRTHTAGVSVRLDEYLGLFHAFQVLTPLLPEAKQAIVEIGRYIKNL